jgi:hypothetical protein
MNDDAKLDAQMPNSVLSHTATGSRNRRIPSWCSMRHIVRSPTARDLLMCLGPPLGLSVPVLVRRSECGGIRGRYSDSFRVRGQLGCMIRVNRHQRLSEPGESAGHQGLAVNGRNDAFRTGNEPDSAVPVGSRHRLRRLS